MPNKGGDAATREIREIEVKEQHCIATYIVGVSAQFSEGKFSHLNIIAKKEKCIQDGMNDFKDRTVSRMTFI